MLVMTAGSVLAAIPSTTEYLNALQPMLTGKVISVNEHQVVVATEQGETVVLALDSRSMVPVDVAPGMAARVEFKVMDDGRKLVKRMIPIRSGMNANRELAYSTESASGEAITQYASTSDVEGVEAGPSRASTALSSTNQSLGTSLAATPSTDAYLVAMQPMIAGRVVTVNDHRIVVDTDQGQRVALELDSRTIVPVNLASGMTVRVDYRALEDGPKYAQRITPIKSSANTNVELSYAASPERHEAVAQVAAAPTSAPQPETLPQTASNQSLIALLGFLALGAAGAVAIGRRLHAA
jgi:LPXTG-motif cell wall-anchored protein